MTAFVATQLQVISRAAQPASLSTQLDHVMAQQHTACLNLSDFIPAKYSDQILTPFSTKTGLVVLTSGLYKTHPFLLSMSFQGVLPF